jgi:Uma2 family endonuclease
MSLARDREDGPHREYMSVEEYLRLEEAATEKHEYRDGYRYLRHAGPYGFEAMAGAREPHVRMAMRLVRLLDEHLDDSPCVVYGADMRLAVDDAYFYPDVFVTCNPRTGPAVLAQQDATVIVEILSPGTEGDDRGDKFHRYQQLPSLEEYVLLSMVEPRADLFRRGQEGLWVLHQIGATDHLTLESLRLQIPIERLYRGIDLGEHCIT